MTHRAARRQLHALLEGGLAPAEAAALQTHLDGCRACQRELRALQATEALVARLPAALVPIGAGAEADARLALLARWAFHAPPERPARLIGRRAIGATLAAASLALAAWLGPLAAHPPEDLVARPTVTVASLVSTSFLAPAFEAPSATPYTWR
jgi:anti-sigma factor RsiW